MVEEVGTCLSNPLIPVLKRYLIGGVVSEVGALSRPIPDGAGPSPLPGHRLEILACPVTWPMQTTTFLMEGRFPSDGQHLRLCTLGGIPQPVTSGATAVSFMKCGVWDECHSRTTLMLKYVAHI